MHEVRERSAAVRILSGAAATVRTLPLVSRLLRHIPARSWQGSEGGASPRKSARRRQSRSDDSGHGHAQAAQAPDRVPARERSAREAEAGRSPEDCTTRRATRGARDQATGDEGGVMSTPDKPREGWHRPPQSRKFHWFIDGGARSLCGRFGFAFGADLQANDIGSTQDDCRECAKKLAKRAGS